MISSVHWRPASLALLIMVAACSHGSGAEGGGQGGGGGKSGRGQNQGPPEVGFVVVQPTSAPQEAELSGRTAAYESSDVRPQVGGVIQRRLFKEGTLVRQGQPLYQIDSSLYRAATNQAAANLQAAQANAEATRIQAERYAPLEKIQAVSKQEYTNAVAAARQGGAQVAQNRAALQTARINLKFTTVPAPITGRIGRSLFTVGALVSPSQTDPLAQIQRLDPIYVDIQQSAADLLTLRRELSQGGVTAASAAVRLVLEDGSDYPATGTVEFAEALVDTSTGTVTLRARFPNGQGVLLPGMFVRAKFTQAINQNAFLVPQQAISRDPKGGATLFLIGPEGNKAVQRTVKADRTQGKYWVVTQGLKAGDKVVTQGLAQLKPNQQVKAVPANTPERLQPPQQGKGKGQGGGGQGGGGQGGGRG
ncbi:efflux RND transporter periplasmic adaptor subunit [uncultured Sphingomonas sp.]|uniref:efflux RND transporter periplasmic adaptor subunit n=1 Tax=uncultured Sphingomonas sp. TaxID=158754 RepID=UPI0035CA2074